MTRRRLDKTFLTLVPALIFLVSAPAFAADSDWEYGGEIYLWGATITSSTPGGRDAELPFYKILDDLQMTFMGAAGARNDKWSFVSDIIYLDLKDKVNRDHSTPGGREAEITGDVELKSWIVTPMVGYAIHNSEKARVDIVGGVRYLWLKAGAEVYFDGDERFNESTSDSYWDAVIGMRARVNLNEKWFVPLYFDIGTGDTDGTWQALAGIGYQFNSFSTTLAYRYLDFNFDDDNRVLAEMKVNGALLGFTFVF